MVLFVVSRMRFSTRRAADARSLRRILDGHNEHRKLSAVERGLFVDRAEFGNRFFKSGEHVAAELLMGDLASLEAETDPDLVAFLKEFDRAVRLGLEIVGVDPAGKLDLLDLDGLLLLLGFLLGAIRTRSRFLS